MANGRNVGMYLDEVSYAAFEARAKAAGLSAGKLAARIIKREIADPRDAAKPEALRHD
jgi:hypothetical protein